MPSPLSRPTLLFASALSLTGVGAHAAYAAASDTQLNAIEQQIKSLQAELRHMKAEAAARDHELKAARATPAPTNIAPVMPAIPAGYALVPASPGATPGSVVLARAEAPKPRALPQGTFQVGGLNVTLGGFIEAAGIYRSRNEVTDITSNFGSSIPLRNSPLYHEPEFRETERRTTLQAYVDGKPDEATEVSALIQSDFQGGAPTSNSNQSNGFVPRITQGWAEYARSDLGFYFLGGQAWSLLTMTTIGINPLKVNNPQTIDGGYVPGFNWTRQPQARFAKSFNNGQYWLALSVENSQTTYSNTSIPLGTLNTSNPGTGALGTGTNTATAACTAVSTTTKTTTTTTTKGTKDTSASTSTSTSTCTTTNVASLANYSNNFAPDLIVKATADYPFAHLEAFGLGRVFNDRISETGTGQSNTQLGGGVGGAALIHVIPKKLDFQVSGIAGAGIGRYTVSQLPDATVDANGKPKAVRAWTALTGLLFHATPALDLYAFLGTEQADAAYFNTYSKGVVTKAYGYGNPLYVNTSCYAELGASSSCTGTTKAVVQGTVGAWYKFLRGPYGTMQVGAQYSYTRRFTFEGVGGAPQTDENIVMMSFRYYPFQ